METENTNQTNAGQAWTVISLGGSLISPDRVDGAYIKSFVSLLKSLDGQFAVITGGGHVSREYRDALIATGITEITLLDQIGIDATRLNAALVRRAFGESAEPQIFLDPTTVVLTGKKILVGGGWKPGHSSDGSAVGLAKTLDARKLVNLSNIDYVYTADPRTNPDAQKIEKISWTEFRKLLPKTWDPGLSAPFDPIAAQMAEELGIEVAVMNGKNLENLKDYIEGKGFIGTVIS